MLSCTIGKTLSSYTRAINRSQSRTGNLFQKKTKAKCLNAEDHPGQLGKSLLYCVHYIHHNPVKAGLAANPEGWAYSSAKDYFGLRKGTLYNKELLYQLGGFNQKELMMPVQGIEKIEPLFFV